MNKMIELFINNLTKEDIIKYAIKNNLYVSEHELEFIYTFIKNNYQNVLKDPKSFDITLYKDNFSNENYLFIKNLVDKYKRMII